MWCNLWCLSEKLILRCVKRFHTLCSELDVIFLIYSKIRKGDNTMNKLQKMMIAAAMVILPCMSCHAANMDAPILHSPVMTAEHIDASDYNAYKWRNDTESAEGLPVNFRTSISEFGKPNPKYGLDDNYVFSCDGLDSIHMSGSGEYTEAQFHNMLSELKQFSDPENIYVIDLRQESHIFADGNALCWWGERDWSNLGKSAEEIEEEERALVEQIMDTEITVVPQKDTEDGTGVFELNVTDTMTERTMVENAGAHYYRIPCTDHIWPDAEQVDAFIDMVKSLPDDAWLHFHCVAGKGRTGAMMCIYDIMRNPDVKLKDIAYRQHLLGANYLLDKGDDTWTGAYKAEVSLMLTAFYSYAQECGADGYQKSWSEWLMGR